MYANKVKKIAAVHDLSGMGRVSLTVVIPILSSMGFQVCPLPTAGFSSLPLADGGIVQSYAISRLLLSGPDG